MNAMRNLLVTFVGSLLVLFAAPVGGAVVTASYSRATHVPVTAASYTAAGNTVDFTLNFAPPVGTALTVVKVTGPTRIEGMFGNLEHGADVLLEYGGITYPFVANYYGGTGNDLVLEWGNTRLLTWGSNREGQLGTGNFASRLLPGPVDSSGVLAGKVVLRAAGGEEYSVALCTDGTLAAWGENDYGQLGVGSDNYRISAPTAVDVSGVLMGRRVIQLVPGQWHCLALCADGTIAAWGRGISGQLGNNQTEDSKVPVEVDRSGVLAGKTVVALAAGATHSLALCADGTVAGWGNNYWGLLGTEDVEVFPFPVLVDRTGILAGKSVVAIAVGEDHSLALCSDGTLAGWGLNRYGAIGTGDDEVRRTPVQVGTNGALAGKTIVAIEAGSSFSLALADDGTMSTWGSGYSGKLGNNSTSTSFLPVAVDFSGVLARRTVTRIHANGGHSFVTRSDGALVAWGWNSDGQVGNNSTENVQVPILVSTASLNPGERFVADSAMVGMRQSLVLAASPVPPLAETLGATDVRDTSATLGANVNPNGATTTVRFEFGPTTAYGSMLAATPGSVTGTGMRTVTASGEGFAPGQTYHYRVLVENVNGAWRGEDRIFDTGTAATLSSLIVGEGDLVPEFSPSVTEYTVNVPNAAAEMTLTPGAANAASAISVNGMPATSGELGEAVILNEGYNEIRIVVNAPGGESSVIYKLTAIRMPRIFRIAATDERPVEVRSLVATGEPIGFELLFPPEVGTSLTVVDNIGNEAIGGTFEGLDQAQRVVLNHAGIDYEFAANYFGGDGNDLVLQWPNTRIVTWGKNEYAQAGRAKGGYILQPTPLEDEGVLAGKTVLQAGAGEQHSVVRCVDGTLASFGWYHLNRLGRPTSPTDPVPGRVVIPSLLAEKMPVSIAVGNEHTLALCSDGTLLGWGSNIRGALSTSGGALDGKRVIAISAGDEFSLALCSDGTMAAWGWNRAGELGVGDDDRRDTPTAVDHSGVLAGKRVVKIAAGWFHCLALCSDGTLVSWGVNSGGQLGTGDTTRSSVPVRVDQRGVLAGRVIDQIAVGGGHSVVLCEDGTLVSWGENSSGQVGDVTGGSDNEVPTPVIITPGGPFAGKRISSIHAGTKQTYLLFEDGTAAAWGAGGVGELGNNSSGTNSHTPVAVSMDNLLAGERLIDLGTLTTGSFGSHVIGVVAAPPRPSATTLAATEVRDRFAIVNADINPNGTDAAVRFEYGLTPDFEDAMEAAPIIETGSGVRTVSVELADLLQGHTYHCRVVATGVGGTRIGATRTFTTTILATLESLALSEGILERPFERTRLGYVTTVPMTTDGIAVTATATDAGATIEVNGRPVVSGSSSPTLPLGVGNNAVIIAVRSGDGLNLTEYRLTVIRLPETITWSSPDDVSVTAGNFIASGNTVSLALGHAPEIGSRLTVIDNTGPDPIRGTFDNLAAGQAVRIEFGGITYPFVANYTGGDGNDLVLEWGSTRLVSWGLGTQGLVEDGAEADAVAPTPVIRTGPLAGMAVRDVTCGESHSLALSWDGRLVGWGGNRYGQLGNGSRADSIGPVEAGNTGALAGRTVVAIASGGHHNLALCSDGTLAAWGYNSYGRLGDGGTEDSPSPVLVSREGALAGKRVVGVAAGEDFSVALCSDGTVSQWGRLFGYDGGGSVEVSSVPVSIQERGALAGRKVVAIRAGFRNCLALCADGTLVAWGVNVSGALGNGEQASSGSTRYEPVSVMMSGALAGKTVAEMAVGSGFCLVLCSDGTLVSWGNNYYGQLGIGNKTDSLVPVLVDQSGLLSGKSVVRIFCGGSQGYALCGDGTMAAWGYNRTGGLGTGNTTDSSLPVLVSTDQLAEGERFTWGGGAGTTSSRALATVASPPPPEAVTLEVTEPTDTSATLQAAIRPNGAPTTVWFEYGSNDAYGRTARAVESPMTGTGVRSASLPLAGLRPGAIYHYRVVAEGAVDRVVGEDRTFTTSTLATLAALSIDAGGLYPPFEPSTTGYSVTVPHSVSSVTLTPTVAVSGAMVTVNGSSVADGAASDPVTLASGNMEIPVVVTAADGTFSTVYTVTVTRVPEVFAFGSAGDVPVMAAGFVAGGPAALALGFAPEVGTSLTMVDNTGRGFIRGRFENLAHGQFVDLEFEGLRYRFRVDYHGGTGNDLVLQWANTRLVGWGRDDRGQLGVGDFDNTNPYPLPPTDRMQVLAGKTVTAVACSFETSIALCADGTLATWGLNYNGQLGNGTINQWSNVPVAVDLAGDLVGKTVIAVTAGNYHKLVLCADGTLAAWGSNAAGQLGATGTLRSTTPVLLEKLGALDGKTIVAIDAGAYHNLVLCEDGTLAAWGSNTSGQLGTDGTEPGMLPSIVGVDGILAGREVVAISAGESHNLALCADGSIVAWGSNNQGQLGNGLYVDSPEPVLVKRDGALAGRTVVAIAAGSNTSMVLCDDGSIATWGYNNSGALGNDSQTGSAVPVEVDRTGVLAGRTVLRIDGANNMNFAFCADGTIAGWGFSSYGALGTGGTNPSNTKVPVAVTTDGLGSGERYVASMTGPGAQHSFALVASPLRAGAETLAASELGDFDATLHGIVQSNGAETVVMFQFGLTTDYGTTVEATPARISGGAAAVSAGLSGLLPGTSYHYRVLATNAGGTRYGEDRSFTTGDAASLASLVLSEGALAPAFGHATTSYGVTVPFDVGSATVTAEARHSGATIRIGGIPADSGVASAPIALVPGLNVIPVVVRAADGVTTHSYRIRVTRVPESVVYRSGTEEPISAEGFTALGKAPVMSLDFAPAPGTNLMVVHNTGRGFIEGRFANLAHGQRVELAYGGVVYAFVANYFGGTGNDLVLQWANTRVMAWARYGTDLAPTGLASSGALEGKTVLALSGGNSHVLALCADGTVAAWGSNSFGQLGDGTLAGGAAPMAVDRSGVLAGKQVVQVVAGDTHSLALCADGTLAGWGDGSHGELGSATAESNNPTPVEVRREGALAGRTIVTLGASQGSSYAICADGTVAAWGSNGHGQLGNGGAGISNVSVAVAVDASGVLADKRVVAITGGGRFTVALCADGTLASWGYNGTGQLGNGSETSSPVPVAVDVSGVLAGKFVTAISCGPNHVLAACSDGMVASWGYNGSGQLGRTGLGSNRSQVPVEVDRSGVLAGRVPVAVAASGIHSLAATADGFLAAWGQNANGRLGDGTTTDSPVPVAVDLSSLRAGEHFVQIVTTATYNLGLAVSPPPPVAKSLPATDIADAGATLRGRVGPNGSATTVAFEYGLTESYGNSVPADPAVVSGTDYAELGATVSGLLAGTTYHYRVVGSNAGGTAYGEDRTFTTGVEATLAGITLSDGTLNPAFSLTATDYSATVSSATGQLTVTPVAARAGAQVTVNGSSVNSGSASGPIVLAPGNTTIAIEVTSSDGRSVQSYAVTVTRLPEAFVFDSPQDVPVSTDRFGPAGMAASVDLRHAPQPGASLTLVENRGLDPIQGTFANLAQGQLVDLAFGGMAYRFVVNYFGGTGNDLVLQWADTRLFGWGIDDYGQMGGSSPSLAPRQLFSPGVLDGKVPLAVKAGNDHSLALCSDGSILTWGRNDSGQLGSGPIGGRSSLPVVVDQSGALAGKRVVAVEPGVNHNVALCDDGSLVAWGHNGSGSLGDNTTTQSDVPVAVDQSGVLAGRRVVAVAAGREHSLVLCADGTMAAWGSNGSGRLGNHKSENSSIPVAVDHSGVLLGKTVVAVAAGADHNLALCSDGTLVAWGYNQYGQLGDHSTSNRSAPVLVDTSGVLAGKRVTAIAAGSAHSMALCADGTVATWGYNRDGRLGNGDTTDQWAAVVVDRSGVLTGKVVTAISAGSAHSMAACADGTVATWGHNNNGELGDGTGTGKLLPVAVDVTGLAPGFRIMNADTGSVSNHSLAMVGSPPRPAATTGIAAVVTDHGATLNGRIHPNGTDAGVAFEFGPTAAYGTLVAAEPSVVTGPTAVDVSAVVSGLLPGTVYHFRVLATGPGGIARGEDRTFTTGSASALAGLSLGVGALEPLFAASQLSYHASVPNTNELITVTPVVAGTGATIEVNGTTVASGTASSAIDLAVGENQIAIAVASADGSISSTYTVTVTRMPGVFRFDAPGDVPLTTASLVASGLDANFVLGFAPVPGTRLTVVDNTGAKHIMGTFDNLSQGQAVTLTHGGNSYQFVANYFGGTGNDLVLQWAGTRLMGWGNQVPVPGPHFSDEVVLGGTIIDLAAANHFVALYADGSVACWGNNQSGQLGNGTTTKSSIPVPVEVSGVLAGREVVSVAASATWSLALCSDGTVAVWGGGSSGSPVPVELDTGGVLAGREVIDLAANTQGIYALCADGTVATWVNGTPVLVGSTGELAVRKVLSLAAGENHMLALCADGAVAAWGSNRYGILGNNSTVDSAEPVLVDSSGVLAGKTVVQVAAGEEHSLALCSDGSIAAWGYNGYDRLGNPAVGNHSLIPVLVDSSGVLAGKTVTGIAAGDWHSRAMCSDGTLVAWGDNRWGQLGDGTTDRRTMPVEVLTSSLLPGERFLAPVNAPVSSRSYALTALPQWPGASTLEADLIGNTAATLLGSVFPDGVTVAVSFEFGPTSAYGSSVAAAPAEVAGSSSVPVSAPLTGLTPGATYHYRVRIRTAFGSFVGEDQTFTTARDATLADLALSDGDLFPSFEETIRAYAVTVPFGTHDISVTPTATSSGAMVEVDGVPVPSGNASGAIPLAVGANLIPVVATAPAGGDAFAYTLIVTRLPEAIVFDSPADDAMTTGLFHAVGDLPPVVLSFAPPAGTILTIMRHTGGGLIHGRFANLAHGQSIALEHAGSVYHFIANYYGGDGNDLVLQWANTRLVGWGSNSSGQLGNGLKTGGVLVPVEAGLGGALAGRQVLGTSMGGANSMALCADGTLAAWGGASSGIMGNGENKESLVPVAVDQTGVLAGKTVVAAALWDDFAVALCSDGSLAGWGVNYQGQLASGSLSWTPEPVAIEPSGALAGRRVTAVAVGDAHVLALCADGALVGWGAGAGGGTYRPALVSRTGVLAGKIVTSIASGFSHNLALCSDGTVVAWGANESGQLGDNTTEFRSEPVAVDATGALAGKSVIAISAGTNHSLALCADGTLVTWGSNAYGQLGDNSTNNSLVPVAVDQSGLLAGRTIIDAKAASNHSLVLCRDGTIAGWGANGSGAVGDGSTAKRLVPSATTMVTLREGEHFMSLPAGSVSSHQVVLVGAPAAVVSTFAATGITGVDAMLHGMVRVHGESSTVGFEIGETDAYGTTIPATPAIVGSRLSVPVQAAVTGLLPGTTYHYRMVVENAFGTVRSADRTFTTLSDNAHLAALGVVGGVMAPDFERDVTDYLVSVPHEAASVMVFPLTEHPGARVRIDGVPVASATTSGAINLGVGANPIAIDVTAEDGITSIAYRITVTRLPERFAFNSGADVPVSADGFSARGISAELVLNFAPVPGTILTVVDNRALGFIHGTFLNLAQGQRVSLAFGGGDYEFVANYFGGTGNDLVLQWADVKVASWGSNNYGQLGDGTTTRRLAPVDVSATGLLRGRTVTAVSSGYLHSLVLCADGTLAAWGYNVYGQLGNGGAAASHVPVEVDQSGVLAGRTVVAISAGPFHNLALCADGTVAAWGYNNYGQLGTGNVLASRVPVLVPPAGALAGKPVVGVAAGAYQSFAWCADGTVAAWGYNDEGELGDGTLEGRLVPVAVDASGVLAGRKVAALSAGQYHTLALCTDGTLVAWGYNDRGQLGDNSTVSSRVPVAVDTGGVLAGRTVAAVRAGDAHSLALCADGTLAAWGANNRSQLGVDGIPQSNVPVEAGPAAAAATASIAVGRDHTMTRLADGDLSGWGNNANGQLGNNSTTTSAVPSMVEVFAFDPEMRFMFAASGASSLHSLAVAGVPVSRAIDMAAWLKAHRLGSSDMFGDPDRDGIHTIMEYAFGLDPMTNSAGGLPQGIIADGHFVISFTQPAGVTGITYGAEWSETLEPGSWTEVPDTGVRATHTFRVPVDASPRIFVRLKAGLR